MVKIIPGLILCLAVTGGAIGLEHIEATLFGRNWLEALVLAILLGTAIRTAWTPAKRWLPGISFSARALLEIAVLLLGASISAQAVLAAGWGLFAGIVAVVVMAIAGSYAIGRLLGLPHCMATLVACGNSICGNSAIAAVAPVIGACAEDISASIAFTAVLGVIVVLGLPLLPAVIHMTGLQYGVLAGLTVYAVPQVLAATAPIGAIAVQMGTLVKLMRVLMLGPVILTLSLLTRRGDGRKATLPPLHRLVPWFIIGFVVLAAIRSAGLIPNEVLPPISAVAGTLTVISMAALGLSTDLNAVAKAGGRVTATVTLSLMGLGAISLLLIRVLGIV